jgi:predicted MFS family arabinose efflux permease
MMSDTNSTVSPHQRLEWSAKVVMLCGGLIVALALGGINSVLPQIEAELAHGARDSLLIKQLVGIVGLSMVIGAPLAGFLIDRIGARIVVIIAAFLYAVIGTAGLYLSSLPALIVSRLLLGLTAVAVTTTAMTMINTRLEGVARARWMGAHVGVAMIGSIIINPIGGYLGEFGWRWTFTLYGIGLPLSLIAFGLHRRVISRPQTSIATSTIDKGPGLLTWFPVRYAVLALVIGSITYLPMVYVPFLMRNMGISSPTVISLVLTGDVALGATLALLYGKSRRYFSIQSSFAFSFACAGIGMSLVAMASTVVSAVIGMMAFGVGLGWFVPNLMTAVAQQVSLEQQGRAVGLVKGAHHLAAPLCIVLIEPFARQAGPKAAMMAAAALAFVMFVLMSYQAVAGRQRARATTLAARTL